MSHPPNQTSLLLGKTQATINHHNKHTHTRIYTHTYTVQHACLVRVAPVDVAVEGVVLHNVVAGAVGADVVGRHLARVGHRHLHPRLRGVGVHAQVMHGAHVARTPHEHLDVHHEVCCLFGVGWGGGSGGGVYWGDVVDNKGQTHTHTHTQMQQGEQAAASGTTSCQAWPRMKPWAHARVGCHLSPLQSQLDVNAHTGTQAHRHAHR